MRRGATFGAALLVAAVTAGGIGALRAHTLAPSPSLTLHTGESVTWADVEFRLESIRPVDVASVPVPTPAGAVWVQALIHQELLAAPASQDLYCETTFESGGEVWQSDWGAVDYDLGSGVCGFLEDAAAGTEDTYVVMWLVPEGAVRGGVGVMRLEPLGPAVELRP